MTDKQFSILRTVIVGATFFIGGGNLFFSSDFSGFVFIVGGVPLVKEHFIKK